MQSNGTINGAGADTSAPAAATAFTTAATHNGNGNRTAVGATPPADSFVFKKAVKHEAKGRIALVGPAGAGKSYTMLKLARALAGPNGKIAAIDTEHGSLSKYADLVEFDVLELDSFAPQNFLNSLHAAEEAGYAVFCTDSLSGNGSLLPSAEVHGESGLPGGTFGEHLAFVRALAHAVRRTTNNLLVVALPANTMTRVNS